MMDLAHSPDFQLGSASIRPSSREILHGGAAIMVEPKVMQMLVALADPVGRVVPRVELVERCWSGRIVGEDAINRVLGKLRRAADGRGFRIETVARVGYRLVVVATHSPVEGSGPARSPIRWAIVPVVAAGLAASWLLLSQPKRPALPTEPLATAPKLKSNGLPLAVHDLETRGLAAMFENTPEQTSEAIGYLKQAAEGAPGNAGVWGSLAMSYVLSLGWAAPGDRAGVATRVQDAARRGLAIDPHEARSLAAITSLTPTYRHWNAKAAALADARRRAPDDEGPLLYQEVQFLMAVGHTGAALIKAQQLVDASPLVPWIRAAEIDLLAVNGRLAEADRAAAQAGAIWPRERLIWWTRFDLAAFHGAHERAAAMVFDKANWPIIRYPGEVEAAGRMLDAMASGDQIVINRVVAEQQALVSAGQGRAERAMRIAAALGRPQTALAFARQLYLAPAMPEPRGTMLPYIGLGSDSERPTAALFVAPAVVLWQLSGFGQLLANTGLIDYWRVAGAPDLCRKPPVVKNCSFNR